MYKKMRTDLYWPHMENEVYAILKDCRSFVETKGTTYGHRKHLRFFSPNGPLEFVMMIVLRPLSKDKLGKIISCSYGPVLETNKIHHHIEENGDEKLRQYSSKIGCSNTESQSSSSWKTVPICWKVLLEAIRLSLSEKVGDDGVPSAN